MNDLMIDLETLGLYPGSVLLSIGAVFFDLKSDVAGETYYRNIDKGTCMQYGMFVDPDTEGWWLKQSEEARMTLQIPEPVHISIVMEEFAEWVHAKKSEGPLCVWSNGASFDIPLLRDAERRTKKKMPWNYRFERDTRTMLMIAEQRGGPARLSAEVLSIRPNTAHHALDDAIAQAKQMQACWRIII